MTGGSVFPSCSRSSARDTPWAGSYTRTDSERSRQSSTRCDHRLVPYTPLQDARAADWFADADVDVWTKIAFGPPGYPEYVRVFFVNETDRSDFAEPAMPAILELLDRHTTSNECFVALWEGYGAGSLPPGPRFDAVEEELGPVRTYVLLRAALNQLFEVGTFEPDQALFEEPHAIWPADRSWFIAADVDPEWCTVGTTREAALAILADPRFDAESISYGERLTVEGR